MPNLFGVDFSTFSSGEVNFFSNSKDVNYKIKIILNNFFF